METVIDKPKLHSENEHNALNFSTEMKEAAKRFEEGVTEVKAAVTAKLDDGKHAAERLWRHSLHAVEDGMEETAHQVKRHPFGSLALAFAAGAALGLLVPRHHKAMAKAGHS